MTTTFNATIHQFEEQGEKTGWTYIEVPADIVQRLKPGNKKIFRVKGRLDHYPVKGIALMPMGDGSFIMPLNAAMRKGIGKRKGATLHAALEADDAPLPLSPELLACLADEPEAQAYFGSLIPSRQRYFSNWIESAKTEPTRIKRIALAINALARGLDFGQMLREQKAKKNA